MGMQKYLTKPPAVGYYKFVKVNDEYRFIEASDNFHASHKDCINDGDKATSAGTIGIRADHWTFYDVSSMSLRVGMSEADNRNLTNLLGKPYKDRYS